MIYDTAVLFCTIATVLLFLGGSQLAHADTLKCDAHLLGGRTEGKLENPVSGYQTWFSFYTSDGKEIIFNFSNCVVLKDAISSK